MAKQQQQQEQPRLLVNLQSCKFDVVRQVTRQLGYDEVEEEQDDWHLLWSDLSVSIERVSKLRQYQRLNHFPSMLEICRKGPLSRHMARMAQRLPEEYSFYPHSYNLPDQLEDLLVQLRRNEAKMSQGQPAQTYILKPTNGSQGHGIHLVQTCGQLQELGREVDIGSLVAQAYISHPLLLDGFKFDLRIYALVLSVDPLTIYLYDEGLARLATVPYQAPSANNLDTVTMHLTNYSVNKKSSTFVNSDGPGGLSGQATKRPASSVLQRVADSMGCSKLWQGISDIIVRTVLAIQPVLSHKYHTAISCANREAPARCAACPCLSLDHWSDEGSECSCPPSQCFELLGFDILFDSDLKPWLLEVNHSPSLACDAHIDQQVKSALLADTICALGQRPEDRVAYYEEQHRATTERLYSQSSPGVRRPLTSIPKSRQLQAACAALDELTGGSSTPRNGRSGSTTASPGKPALVRPDSADFMQSRSKNLGSSLPSLGPGLVPDQQSLPGSIGRFSRIYPPALQPAQQRSKLLRIMLAASSLFPDQRCSCAWCARRTRARQFASTSRELHAVATAAVGKPRNRPSSASCAMATLTAVSGPSNSSSGSSSSAATHQHLVGAASTLLSTLQASSANGKQGGTDAGGPSTARHAHNSQEHTPPAAAGSPGPLGRPPQVPGRLKAAWYDAVMSDSADGGSSRAAALQSTPRPQSAAFNQAKDSMPSNSNQRQSSVGAGAGSSASSRASSISLEERFSGFSGRNSAALVGGQGEGGEEDDQAPPHAPPPRPTSSRCIPPRPYPQLSSSRGATDRKLEQCMRLLYRGGRSSRALSAPDVMLQRQQTQHDEVSIQQGHNQISGMGSPPTSHHLHRATSAGAGSTLYSVSPGSVLAGSGNAKAGVGASSSVGASASTPERPRRSSAPLVPRVALLTSPSSARRGRGRQMATQLGDAPVDPQLLLLRMKTAAGLSNSFVTCYVSDLPTGTRTDQVRTGRAASARR